MSRLINRHLTFHPRKGVLNFGNLSISCNDIFEGKLSLKLSLHTGDFGLSAMLLKNCQALVNLYLQDPVKDSMYAQKIQIDLNNLHIWFITSLLSV